MQSNKLLMAMLVTAGLVAAPAQASVDPEVLMQAYEKLLQRVEQLEAANKKLEATVEQSTSKQGAGDQVEEIAERVEDIETQIVKLNKPRKVEAALEGITAGASLAMVAQRALNGTATGKDESQLNYRADIEVEVPGDALGKLASFGDSKFFAHFRAGQGEGFGSLNPTLTGTANSTTFQLTNGDDSAAILAQAWYQLGIPLSESQSGRLGRIEATIGKMDMFGFFDTNEIADDESEGFLNNVFVHNPLLDSGGDIGADGFGFAPGLHLAYINDINSVNHWTFSLGLFGAGSGASFSDSFTRPFVIGQAEYTGRVLRGLPGNYRLYAWHNGQAIPFANEFDSATESHSGFGFSIDQQVARYLTLFTRYGHSTQGNVKFDQAFTLGGQLGGYTWGRQHDRVGLAFGWLSPSSEFKAAAPTLDADADTTLDFGFMPTGAEKQAELFYAWQVNDSFQLSPSLQWIDKPGGDSSADDIVVLGLRVKAAF
jgi:hypothetical protein